MQPCCCRCYEAFPGFPGIDGSTVCRLSPSGFISGYAPVPFCCTPPSPALSPPSPLLSPAPALLATTVRSSSAPPPPVFGAAAPPPWLCGGIRASASPALPSSCAPPRPSFSSPHSPAGTMSPGPASKTLHCCAGLPLLSGGVPGCAQYLKALCVWLGGLLCGLQV